VQATRDAGSGLPTGKKKYMPITLTRYSDAASVNIFEAVSTNEDLKLVTIQLIRRSPEGKTQVYETIKLQNATVSSYVQYEGTGAPIRYGTNTTPVEEIQFTFQKISWQMVDSKTTATDDWLAGQ
jgi:type VI secretion system Hcp family effector